MKGAAAKRKTQCRREAGVSGTQAARPAPLSLQELQCAPICNQGSWIPRLCSPDYTPNSVVCTTHSPPKLSTSPSLKWDNSFPIFLPKSYTFCKCQWDPAWKCVLSSKEEIPRSVTCNQSILLVLHAKQTAAQGPPGTGASLSLQLRAQAVFLALPHAGVLHLQHLGDALLLFPSHLISFQSPFPGATLSLTDPTALSPLELLAATVRGPGHLFSRCTGLHTDTFVPQEAEN